MINIVKYLHVIIIISKFKSLGLSELSDAYLSESDCLYSFK